MSNEAKAKMAEALSKELEKMAANADQRRRRDPTFKPDAIDLDRSKMRKYNKYVDYYEQLGVDKFCPPWELKDAYKKKSLALHPDKQMSASEEARIKAAEEYHIVQKAYDILSEAATRQAYDKARVKVEAEYEAGIVSTVSKCLHLCTHLHMLVAPAAADANWQGAWARMRCSSTGASHSPTPLACACVRACRWTNRPSRRHRVSTCWCLSRSSSPAAARSYVTRG